MVSVLHKELEYKAEKVKYNKVGRLGAKDQNQNPDFQLANKPFWIRPHKYLSFTVVID